MTCFLYLEIFGNEKKLKLEIIIIIKNNVFLYLENIWESEKLKLEIRPIGAGITPASRRYRESVQDLNINFANWPDLNYDWQWCWGPAATYTSTNQSELRVAADQSQDRILQTIWQNSGSGRSFILRLPVVALVD